MTALVVTSRVKHVRGLAQTAWRTGLPHYLFALVAVQGGTFIAQFAIARILTPAAFGVVRTVEATLGLALVLASAGLPSLAIKSNSTKLTKAEINSHH